MKYLLLLFLLLSNISFANNKVVLTSDNMIILDRRISYSDVAPLQVKMREMDQSLKSGYPIYLVIDSGGGSISAGLQFIEFMKGLNKPVYTLSIWSGSMAFQIAQMGDKRLILYNGEMMAHKARGSFWGEFGDGQSQLDSQYSHWLRRIRTMDELVVSKTNGKLTLNKFRDLYENELWVDGTKAKKLGLVDEIVIAQCDKTVSGTRTKIINMFGYEFHLILDNCPLNSGILDVIVMLYTNRGKMSYDEFISNGGKFVYCRKQDEYNISYTNGVDNQVIPKELCTNNDIDVKELLENKKDISNKYQKTVRKVEGYLP